MPSEKEVTRCIPKIYKRNAENIMLFAWVKAQKQIVPTITLEQSIMNYFHFACISVDEWDMECTKATYFRLQKEYYEDCKS
jgi:hypothetical protein